MKIHHTAIHELVRVFTTYGGHKGEKRLIEQIGRLEFSEYKQQSGEKVLVLSKELQQELRNRTSA